MEDVQPRTGPAVAAAVVTYNHRDAVVQLLAFLDARGIPTFVTENACSDGTREAIRERFGHVSMLESPENLGGCGGFDCAVLAALSAGTDYVLLIDDDALPIDDCIEQLTRFLDEHQDYVFAAPAVYIASKPDTLQETGGTVDFASDFPVQALHRFAVDPELPARIDIQYASACCLMVRADAVMRIGVMDWSYFIFSDDVDWSVRLRRAFGKRAACVSSAKVMHEFPWTKPFSAMRLYFFQRNGLYFLSRLREGDASAVVVRTAVMRLAQRLLYSRLIGDHEMARTLRDALVDAFRGRYGAWRRPVAFPGARRPLDQDAFRRRGIKRVLVDLVIEDLGEEVVGTIRRLGGDGVAVDLLCDRPRVSANREKGLFDDVHGRRAGAFGWLKDVWQVRRRGYDLTITDASMEPRRPPSTCGRHAAFFHDGALYEASAVGVWSCVAHLASSVLARGVARLAYGHFLVPPPPGRPPRGARPLLERIGVQPEVGQPWARDWVVPFPVPRAGEAAVLRVPAPHVRPTDALWTPLHPPVASAEADEYDAWCAARRRSAGTRYAGVGQGPRFSVIVSVADGNRRWLAECLASVHGQTYEASQVIVIDEDRVAARTRAVSGASGDYLLFVDGSDLLDPYALAAFAQASDGGRADLLYADEDRIDAEGRRRDPDFKPAFSPTKLAASNYIGRPVAMRRALFERIDGARAEGDHDLLLRAVAPDPKVVHVPDVLYHRRLEADPSSDGCRTQAEMGDQRRRAQRLGASAEISVLVLGEGATPEHELRSIWAGCECLVAPEGGGSAGQGLEALARRASGEVLLIVSSELRPVDRWRDSLVASVRDPAIGLVGGRLRYHDGRLHSAGLVLGIAGAVGRWQHGRPASDPGYGNWIALPHEVSALPCQFLGVRREVFLAEGGFDPAFGSRGFDVDLALRLTARLGLRHVYLPETGGWFVASYPELALEAWSLDDLMLLWGRWGAVIRRGDPYMNPNLSLLGEDVRYVDEAESQLRERGALMAYDRPTVRRLAERFGRTSRVALPGIRGTC